MTIARIRLWCRSAAALLILSSGACAWADQNTPPVSDALAAYVSRPDTSYAWRVRSRGAIGKTRYVELIMSSQIWRDTLWRHQLFIIDPVNRSRDSRQALLFISGGRWKPELDGDGTPGKLPRNAEIFVGLARKLGTPVAILRHVPYQPLFDGLTEDWIIALTFERYLETGDADWPLLLPMVKTVVRAMDATQEFAEREWGVAIESFTLAGASKRGWTTWLAGATDARVAAMAPMVIDVLNMGEQMEHARASWGKPSHKIRPYTERGLIERLASPGGRTLLDIVDPYSYRHVLTQPKLIVNGTNDEYWPLDALNLYWPGLEGDKYVLYVPNHGHNIKDYRRVVGSVAALHRHVAHGAPLPEIEWHFTEDAKRVRLQLRPSMRPKRVVAWVATSPTRDFRGARWRQIAMKANRGQYSVKLKRPRTGYLALLGEGTFTRGFKLPAYFSTTVEIFGTAPSATVLTSVEATDKVSP